MTTLVASSLHSASASATYTIYENETLINLGPSSYGRKSTTGAMQVTAFGPVNVKVDALDVDLANYVGVYLDGTLKGYLDVAPDIRHITTISLGWMSGTHTIEVKYVSGTGDWVDIYSVDLEQTDSIQRYSDTTTHYFRYSYSQTPVSSFTSNENTIVVSIRFVDIDFANNLWVKVDGVKKVVQPIVDGANVLNGYWTIPVTYSVSAGSHTIQVGVDNTGDWINVYSIKVFEQDLIIQ